MDFVDFARGHGLLITSPIMDSQWHRVPTESHPKKRNGAYRFCGSHGHIQDHATMLEPELWTPGKNDIHIDRKEASRLAEKAHEQIKQGQIAAAKKAQEMLDKSLTCHHPYLESKGFPNAFGRVLDGVLLIPMRVGKRLVGVQRINQEGEKRFLQGQQTSGATFAIHGGGDYVFCEGYATGLSAQAALDKLNIHCTLLVCFSASNMLKIAKTLRSGFVVADCDRPHSQAPEFGGTGISVAKQSGLRYWSSGVEGIDFNDFYKEHGLFKASQSLRKALMAT